MSVATKVKKATDQLCEQCGFKIAKGKEISACPLCKKSPVCESCYCSCEEEKREGLANETDTVEEHKPGETMSAPDGSGTITMGHPPEYYGSPEYLAIYDAETELNESSLLADIGQIAISQTKNKGEAKRIKKQLESAEEDYLKYIEDRANARGRAPEPKARDLYPDPVQSSDESPKHIEVNPESDAWKEVDIGELVEHDGLSEKVATILRDNGLDTLGKIADYTQPNASGWCNKLTDLKGFGPKKHDDLEAATTRFWARKAANEQGARSENSQPGVEGDYGESGNADVSIDDDPTGEEAANILNPRSEKLPD